MKRLIVLVWIAVIVARTVWAAEPTDAIVIEEFRSECAKKAETGADSLSVSGRDGWLFLTSELRHMSMGEFWGANAMKVSRATKVEWADPLPAILDFHAQMEKSGVELLLVTVPPKVAIYPEMLAEKYIRAPRLDIHHAAFYKLLTGKGVKVLDLAMEFLEERKERPTRLLYCKTDTHWTPYACELTAKLIKQHLADRDWLTRKQAVPSVENRSLEIAGDLAKPPGSEKETLMARIVISPANDRASPVLLLGDSHCLVFQAGDDMHSTGAGLADQLAAELGISIDLLGVRGSGATPSRISLMQRVRADDKYLTGKKLIIWCLSAREFTESQGWRNVPVVK